MNQSLNILLGTGTLEGITTLEAAGLSNMFKINDPVVG